MIDLRPYEKLHTIQMLKGIIRRWWRVELAFADGKGYVLDHAEGKVVPPNNEFCRQALFSREGFRRCNESVKHAGSMSSLAPSSSRESLPGSCSLAARCTPRSRRWRKTRC